MEFAAVGYQATTNDGKTEKPNVVLEGLIRVVRATGGLGIPGLYVSSDPGAPDSASAKYVSIFIYTSSCNIHAVLSCRGYMSFPFGKLLLSRKTLRRSDEDLRIIFRERIDYGDWSMQRQGWLW